MRRLDHATFRTMPWKDGGGTTTEVLTVPAGATLDTFEARVSFARVESDGPFSRFVGIDRTLVLTAGNGILLDTVDESVTLLESTSPPFVFAGDDPCGATLKDGPVSDLNVMSRRSVMKHRAIRVKLDAEQSLACAGALSVIVILSGDLTATDDAGALTLTTGDVLTLAPGEPLVIVRPSGAGAEVLLVDFTRR
jgi:environmental stress-induced protein Ves